MQSTQFRWRQFMFQVDDLNLAKGSQSPDYLVITFTYEKNIILLALQKGVRTG